MGLRWILALGLAVVAAGCVSDAPAEGDSQGTEVLGGPGQTVVVEMTDRLTFEPGDVTVRKGTRVVWRNVGDDHSHDVTHDAHAAAFQSYEASYEAGNLKPGDEYEHAFDETGTFPYYCKWHGKRTMPGSVTVVDA